MIEEMKLPPEIQWLNDRTYRNYYNALWATLVKLKPINCLEIGTFLYYSSMVFSHYFHEYAPDGKLITIDISEWKRDKNPISRVYPLMVYPHRVDIDQFHEGIKIYHKNYKSVLDGRHNASILNSLIIHEEMERLNIDLFDFAFIDGSHDAISVLADLTIAKNLTKPGGWLLVDDFADSNHDVHKVVNKLRCREKFYCYTDWSVSPDMGLIATQDFSLEGRLAICP